MTKKKTLTTEEKRLLKIKKAIASAKEKDKRILEELKVLNSKSLNYHYSELRRRGDNFKKKQFIELAALKRKLEKEREIFAKKETARTIEIIKKTKFARGMYEISGASPKFYKALKAAKLATKGLKTYKGTGLFPSEEQS